MVVPIESASMIRNRKPKRYVGNNLTLNIDDNETGLLLTGNNCKVTLEENNGHVKVVGDNCEIVILKGSGNVKYVGNCGKIVLGLGVSSENVDYIGNLGNVTSVAGDETKHERVDTSDSGVSSFCSSGANVNINNSSMIRISSSCLPSNFDVSLPGAHRDPRIRYQGVLLRK